MSKKEANVMAQERHNFLHGLEEAGVVGCIKNGVSEKIGTEIFDAISKFAEYAFNKPHAACYAVVGYQTAWLKYYYPVEFMAAMMTSVMDASAKVAMYIHECKKMGITLLPPDVNEGFGAFSVSGKSIRFGLSSIKNVGRAAVEALVAEREKNGKYKGITDFITRLADADVNKRCLESLIRAGAFDSLGGKRSQYISVFQGLLSGISSQKKNTLAGQISLFDLDETPEAAPETDDLPNMAEFPERLRLFDEKELLGIYVSGHPLAEYEETLRQYATATSLDFSGEESVDSDESAAVAKESGNLNDGDSVKYGGIITAKSVKYTKADNKPFCFLTVEDMLGQVEVIVFSRLYEQFGAKLNEDEVLVIQGRVSAKEDEATKIVAQEFLFYEQMAQGQRSEVRGQRSEKSGGSAGGVVSSSANKVTAATGETFWLKVPEGREVSLKSITDTLAAYPGQTRVMIYDEAKKKKFLANNAFWVTISDNLKYAMEDLLGAGNVKVTG